MSSMRIVLALAIVGALSACAKKATEETVYIEEPTVSVEPTYTGKYK